jgi:hypothetical protein
VNVSVIPIISSIFYFHSITDRLELLYSIMCKKWAVQNPGAEFKKPLSNRFLAHSPHMKVKLEGGLFVFQTGT